MYTWKLALSLSPRCKDVNAKQFLSYCFIFICYNVNQNIVFRIVLESLRSKADAIY